MTVLFGAYHPEGRPLDQRRLLLDVRPALSLDAPRRGLALAGTIEAEGLARRAALSGRVRVRGGRLRYAFEFPGDDSGRYVLSMEQRLDRLSVPKLTVLDGALTERDGRAVGPARLRFDWKRAMGL